MVDAVGGGSAAETDARLAEELTLPEAGMRGPFLRVGGNGGAFLVSAAALRFKSPKLRVDFKLRSLVKAGRVAVVGVEEELAEEEAVTMKWVVPPWVVISAELV